MTEMDLLARVRAEIDARMAELRPAIVEYERLLGAAEALERDRASTAAGASAGEAPAGAAKRSRASSAKPKPKREPAAKPARAKAAKSPRPAAQQAIVAALEHGSHTVAELVLVTAMPGADIRDSLRRL